MGWRISFSVLASKQIKKLDLQTADTLTRYLRDKVGGAPDPRLYGHALKGDKKGYWSYRIGDYRAICELRDRELVILVIEVGHRREVYKRSPPRSHK